MNKRFLFFLYVMLFFHISLFMSCVLNVDNVIKYDKKVVPDGNKRLWTVFIYMAADNDLEYAAMEDICEMECSELDTEKVSVFILLDRSNAYDTSNDNWAGTRLYQLKTGRRTDSNNIISREIECAELGLKKGNDVDLDMSSGYVLSGALSYIKEKYPAENFGFIMWGHGTGWRSSENNINASNLYKGFAYDSTSANYMTLKQFGSALEKGLKGDKLEFLGFDTCFSGEIEVMYELKNLTKYAVGTEGLLFMSGWNYKNIFNDFNSDTLKSAVTLTKNILTNFSKEYSLSTGASIVGVDMAFIDEYFHAFDNSMKHIAENILSRSTRDDIFNMLLSTNKNKTISYSYGKEDSDVYLDINSVLSNFYSYFSTNREIKKSIETFNSIKNKCLIGKWAANGNEGGLGVYYGSLTSGNLIATVHPAFYIKGKCGQQIQFVKDSIGYVSAINNNNNFLGKLFYTSFNSK